MDPIETRFANQYKKIDLNKADKAVLSEGGKEGVCQQINDIGDRDQKCQLLKLLIEAKWSRQGVFHDEKKENGCWEIIKIIVAEINDNNNKLGKPKLELQHLMALIKNESSIIKKDIPGTFARLLDGLKIEERHIILQLFDTSQRDAAAAFLKGGTHVSWGVTISSGGITNSLTKEQFESFQKSYHDDVKEWRLFDTGKTKKSQFLNIVKSMDRDKFNEEMRSAVVISNLPDDKSHKVLINRDFVNCEGNNKNGKPLRPDDLGEPSTKLGKIGSIVRRQGDTGEKEFIGPASQVSVLLKTTMIDNGTPVRPHVLSVPAPALDYVEAQDDYLPKKQNEVGKKSKFRSEVQTYIDTSTFPAKFNDANYKIAFENLANHVVKGAEQCHAKRVVLSAIGVNAFSQALTKLDRINDDNNFSNYNKATDIAAQSFASMITELRASGKEVVFSDLHTQGGFKSGAFWDKVNTALKELNQPQLNPVNGTDSDLDKGWVKNSDMIVNAWDPDSLIGNGLDMDASFDGKIGSMSSLNAVHKSIVEYFGNPQQNSGWFSKVIWG